FDLDTIPWFQELSPWKLDSARRTKISCRSRRSMAWMERFMAEDSGFSIGSPVARLEDERLLRGGGRYVSDLITTSSALHVKVLRSPHAHARLVALDAANARSMAGVVDVLTAKELTSIGDLPCDWVAPGMSVVPQHPILARDRVRYVGQPVAVVAAETAHAAEEAL